MSLLNLHTSGDGKLTASQSPSLSLDRLSKSPSEYPADIYLSGAACPVLLGYKEQVPDPQKALQILKMMAAALSLTTPPNLTPRSPVPLFDISESTMPKFPILSPALRLLA